jgi:cyclic phosphodiesterase-like protein
VADIANDDAARLSVGPAYSLWLLPQADTQEHLAGVIARLSRRFGTRAFEPHVTVQGDLTHHLRDVAAVAGGLAQTLAAQRWRVRGIEQSSHYYRAFHLAFDGCEAFAPLVAASARALATDAGVSPFAHLSLAYGALDTEAKDALAREFAAEIPSMLAFDRLAVALSGKSVGIASWRTLQCFELAQSAPNHSGETSS